MAIDYLVTTSCDPQRTLGADRLVRANRTRILARTALAQMRADGDDRDPGEIQMQLTTHKPDGDSAGRGVTLADLFREAEVLDTVSCKRCPAGFARDFACHRRIRYPIPDVVEEWLMARLPQTLQCTAGALLVRAIGEFGWDGAPTAKLRAAGDTYFESRVPHGVRWAADDGTAIELSSDQLFQMMFMVGNLTPSHALMVLLFTGVIAHDTPLVDLTTEEGRLKALNKSFMPAQPDADIEQLAAFLRAVTVAVRLDTEVLIDS